MPLQLHAGNQSRMYNDNIPSTVVASDRSDPQDDGTLLQPLDVLIGEYLGQRTILVIAMAERFLVQEILLYMGILLRPGKRVDLGIEGVVREDCPVLVVSADGGRAYFHGQVYGAEGVGTLGDQVAGEDDMILLLSEIDLVEEFLD